MTLLELSDKEKDIFFDWLQQRENALSEEIEVLKNLRIKLTEKAGTKMDLTSRYVKKSIFKVIPEKTGHDSLSWVNIIKKELGHFSDPVPSGEIVKRLLQKPSLSEKGKRFITKAVTSKLWLLQERGEVSKTLENGRYVYSLKK